MKRKHPVDIIAAILALHFAGLSVVFGFRHLGYILAATGTATIVWGAVFFVSKRWRRSGMFTGVALGLASQQITFHVWQSELPGFWWSLAQFVALQYLIAFIIRKSAA